MLKPRRLHDGRGYFVETYTRRSCTSVGLGTEFVQDNEALSKARGTLRGLHFQLAPESQAKLVRVVAGAIFDVAVDLRDGSPTFGKWCGVELSASNEQQVFLPIGFAHAYCTLKPDTIVLYKTDEYYSRSAEAGIRWDDPDIGIEWPLARDEIKVSDRDASLPFLRDSTKPFKF